MPRIGMDHKGSLKGERRSEKYLTSFYARCHVSLAHTTPALPEIKSPRPAAKTKQR